jgi:hypothetical protein
MDWWLNDTLESERVCPFWEQSCCPPTFDSYRQVLAHCRQKHPDKPPFGEDPTTELVMMDNQGKVLSWEEVRRLLDHPLFWYRPSGDRLPAGLFEPGAFHHDVSPARRHDPGCLSAGTLTDRS